MSSLSLNPSKLRHAPRKQARILLVDDDPGDLACYLRMLESLGSTIIACESYRTALECLESLRLDGVVVNQGADRFAWRPVVDCAARCGLRVPVLVMTDCRDIVCQLEALQLGAVAYLEKPLNLQQVVEAFERGPASPAALGLPRNGGQRRPRA